MGPAGRLEVVLIIQGIVVVSHELCRRTGLRRLMHAADAQAIEPVGRDARLPVWALHQDAHEENVSALNDFFVIQTQGRDAVGILLDCFERPTLLSFVRCQG